MAVDGTLVVAPDEARFQQALALIRDAPRPVKLTFLRGEGRDDAFREQERQRRGAASASGRMSQTGPRDAPAVEAPGFSGIEALEAAGLGGADASRKAKADPPPLCAALACFGVGMCDGDVVDDVAAPVDITKEEL